MLAVGRQEYLSQPKDMVSRPRNMAVVPGWRPCKKLRCCAIGEIVFFSAIGIHVGASCLFLRHGMRIRNPLTHLGCVHPDLSHLTSGLNVGSGARELVT